MCHGVDSASENEYQRFFPGVKAASAYGWWPATLVVPNVTKIWGLNQPGTPWATSACCGMTFTFINIQDSLLTEGFWFLISDCLLCSQNSFQNLLKSRSLKALMLYLEHGTLVLVEYLGGISDESWSAVEPTSWRSCYYDLELQIWQEVLGLLSAHWWKVC